MICQILEKYPRLSGLTGIKPFNICKKTDKGLIQLNNEKVSECIKSNDVVYFDLYFTEIWLEVEMILCCEDKDECIIFDLKIKTECMISRLKNILIKFGISSLKQTYYYDSSCYYLYMGFEMNISTNITLDSIELDKLDGRYFLL